MNQQLVDEYLEAFRQANPGLPLPTVSFSRGRYRLSGNGVEKGMRAAEVVRMRDTLRRRIRTVSRQPNLEGLTTLQRDHVLHVFPETQASMAEYLRQGAEVFIVRQDEVPDAPPVAIAVLSDPTYWIDCLESEDAALAHAERLGLTITSASSAAQ